MITVHLKSYSAHQTECSCENVDYMNIKKVKNSPTECVSRVSSIDSVSPSATYEITKL